jgi:hypothetical protein
MLVIDRTGDSVLAIEGQGSAHYIGKTAFMRDTVKREALRRAGVGMLEMLPGQSTTAIEALRTKMLDSAGASQRRRPDLRFPLVPQVVILVLWSRLSICA